MQDCAPSIGDIRIIAYGQFISIYNDLQSNDSQSRGSSSPVVGRSFCSRSAPGEAGQMSGQTFQAGEFFHILLQGVPKIAKLQLQMAEFYGLCKELTHGCSWGL